jgi:medium-chain acyl-[acyl-carrier-protein] hydrolase
MTTARWFCHWNPNGTTGRLRLFCFHYAGGGASFCREWPDHCQQAFEIIGVQLPGREHRLREQPYTNMNTLLNDLALAIVPQLNQPCAFFGHSLGATVAFELARLLQHRGLHGPRHLFVSSRSPRAEADIDGLLALSDDDLAREVQRQYGGIPAAVVADKELLSLIVPPLRADLQLLENYVYRQGPRLACPITAFGGSEDLCTGPKELEQWADETRASFRREVLPGGHFYLRDVPRLLTARMIALLAASRSAPSLAQESARL